MSPTPTVENYLKAIFQAQVSRPEADLVTMGEVASALGVTRGTTTTMMKTLSDAGLVRYAPYEGVRLNVSGEKLALRVLRRHRLIELFLERVMGMSWTEVHEEAEHLEHAVSESLIDRMDEMLGRPEVDPHGDPIPEREGTLVRREYDSLVSCPLRTPVVVRRITDQSRPFLQFIEERNLKPGQTLEVEDRDAAADSVTVRKMGEHVTVGTEAAAKLLVEVVMALVVVFVLAGSALAQSPPETPFEILDNSFIVEEAFNQEPGIFQNIFGLRMDDGPELEFGFTQEWPVWSQAHQLSYTLPAIRQSGTGGLGDLLINYRYQLWLEAPGRPAFSPRLSLILPTGNEREGHGAGVVGWQVNLPFSKQRGDLYYHWNAGFTWLPGVTGPGAASSTESDLLTPHVSASAIWRARPMFNVMLETFAEFDDQIDAAGGSERTRALTISPGFRTGWNISNQQVIVGFALPVTFSEGDEHAAAFVYLSYELPFTR